MLHIYDDIDIHYSYIFRFPTEFTFRRCRVFDTQETSVIRDISFKKLEIVHFMDFAEDRRHPNAGTITDNADLIKINQQKTVANDEA